MSDAGETTDRADNEGDAPNGYVGATLFPDNNRRRIPGVMYLITGIGCALAWLARRGHDPVLVNAGYLGAAALLIGVGCYCLIAGWKLAFDEEAALEAAAGVIEHPVGHASAQMGWRGWLSRPTWRILWYSAENPPLHRGLVVVDGHTGKVLDHFGERNPEDWSHLDGRLDQPR